jgi:hypothetical protein
VALQQEPANFANNVRNPGSAFLRRVANPSREQYKQHDYWKRCLPELRTAYGAVCAYSSCWVPTSCSVDHFYPKSAFPHLAYEWDNYRLAHERINNNKGDSTGVLDPFTLQAGWFELDFSSFRVKVRPGLQPAAVQAVNNTIAILQLNSDPFVELRYSVVKDYSDGVPLAIVQRRYPFIAHELNRQGLAVSIIGTVR